LGDSKIIGFRPTPEIRREVDALIQELGGRRTLSDALRDAVWAFWPQLRAYILATNRVGIVPPDQVTKLVAFIAQAGAAGLTPEEIEDSLHQALDANLAREKVL
jgi:Arc/MetJ-type ribon-helix-helix transcriptional regulator